MAAAPAFPHTCCRRLIWREPWTPARGGAAAFVVNRATRGMSARVRWALAPDSSALIVVEDPAGVENEAVPDGVPVQPGPGHALRV